MKKSCSILYYMFRDSFFCKEDKFDREIEKMKKEIKSNNENRRRFFIPYIPY